MVLRYEHIHDGDKPQWEQKMTLATGKGHGIGPVASISYAKKAGETTEIYSHQLKSHDGRRPYLVADHGSGPVVEIEPPPKDLQALGRAIDCVLSSGERILLGGLYVVTDDHGEIVMLASPFDVEVQIEQRGAHVTRRGIEE